MDIINSINFSPLAIDSVKHYFDVEKNTGSTILGANIQICKTCNKSLESGCRGHGGKYLLKKGDIIIKPAYKKAILTAAKDYCLDCRFIKITSESINDLINKKVKKLSVSTKCVNENCKKRNYSSLALNEEKILFSFSFKNNKEEVSITAYEIFQMFSQTPDIIFPALGKVNPKDYFYYEYLYIPSNIIKGNNKLEKIIENDYVKGLGRVVKLIAKGEINKAQVLLFAFDNAKADSEYDQNNKNRAINISKEASGTAKNSILRENLLSSRQDNCYRSVVGSGDAIISSKDNKREAVAPLTAYIPDTCFSNLLTYVTVTVFNKDELTRLLIYSDKISYIYKKLNNIFDGLKYTLINNKIVKYGKIYNIDYGDIVCIKGEPSIVFLNRAPTLHIWNYQPFFIKNSNSFTTNINTMHANQFNMDFDGDTVNGNINKDSEGWIQSREIFTSRHPVALAVMVGNIQDELVILNKISREEVIQPREYFKYLGKYSSLYFKKYKDVRNISGKELVSLFFSSNLNYKNIIKDGVLQVPLSSSLLTSRNPNSLATLVFYEDYNEFASYELVTFFKNIASNLINYKSITFGYKDILLDEIKLKELFTTRDNMMKEFEFKYTKLLKDIQNNKLKSTTAFDVDRIIHSNISIIQNYSSKKLREILDSLEDNTLSVMEKAGYKVSVNDLINVFSTIGIQLNKGAVISPKRQGRNYCTQPNNTLSLKDRGVFTKGLLEGIDTMSNFNSMLALKSIPEVITVNCMTASTGFIGKTIIRAMIDIQTDKFKRTTDGNNLIQLFSYFFGINPKGLCRIDLIEPDPNMSFYEELNEIWNDYKSSMVILYHKKIRQTLFFLNLDLSINSFVSEEETIAEKKDIINLINYINNKYYYNSFKKEYLIYVFLSYLDPFTLKKRYNRKLTLELINKLKDEIDKVFFLFTTAGYGIGTALANTIQERATQNALSNFHTTSKSGVESVNNASKSSIDVINSLLSFNPNTSKKKIRIIKIFSQDKNLLSSIVKDFQLVNFKKLNGNVRDITEDKGKKIYTFKLDFNYGAMLNSFYDINDVSRIIVFYLESGIVKNKIIKYFLQAEKIENGILTFDVQINSNNPYEVILGIKNNGITNRMFNNSYIEISDEEYYDPLGNHKKGYSISLFINSIKDLEKYDLYGCEVVLDLYEQYTIFKRPGLNFMARDTFLEGFRDLDKADFYAAFTILINKLFGCSRLRNFKSTTKTRTILSSTIDKSALINSSIRDRTENVFDSIYGSLATGVPIKRGINTFPVYLHLDNLKSNDSSLSSSGTKEKNINLDL